MLNKEEEAFIAYWRANRERRKKTFRQFLLGIPLALLFVIPIALNYLSGWHSRAAMVGGGLPGILLLALLLIVVFIAIFSQKFKWDQYEQRYQELMAREGKQNEMEK